MISLKTNFLILLVLILLSCKDQSAELDPSRALADSLIKATQDQVDQLIEDIITANDNSIVTIPEGFFEIETQLILDGVSNVKLKGAGIEKSILSFKELTTGGEGVKVQGNNITLEDFSVYDAPGDGIKAQHCDTLLFKRVNATWTNGDKSKNGTYAIYPVQCKNVLIEECHASNSRDAGIYVGQSENIVVRNCKAYGNVAGIEIENCDNSEVYDNLAINNSAGILVFNLPGLPKAFGSNHKIYRNKVIENNHKNFAIAIDDTNNGNAVTQVPPGSGIILLAANDVEIFDNQILNNKTVGISIASYQITSFPFKITDDGWSPYSSNISIHNNSYKRPLMPPDMTKDLGKLIAAKNAYGVGKTQDIIYDGFIDPNKGNNIQKNPMSICIEEDEITELRFTLFDIASADNIKASKNVSPFLCKHRVLTDVEFIKSF